MITNPVHALTFGPLNLIGTKAEQTANGYQFQALGDDADWGNPVPIEVAVESWLQDGANISIERYDNRELFIRVKIVANDSDDLATAEELLVLQCGKPNLLIWTPPDGQGAACVFEVSTSTPQAITDDIADLRNEATYGLRVKAFPFVRSTDKTVVSLAAPAGTQTLTTVDNGSSATGWSSAWSAPGSSSSPTVSSSGGDIIANKVYVAPSAVYGKMSMTRSGLAVSTTTTPYFRIELRGAVVNADWELYGAPTWYFYVNGLSAPVAAQSGTAYWLDLSGIPTVNTIKAEVYYKPYPGATSTIALAIGDISRSNILGDQSTTARELYRTLPVLGSARTQGTISLSDATNALGDVLVHTMPAVPGLAQPNLRVALSSGNATTIDTSIVSGFFSTLANLHTFDIAETGLLPGTYALMARVRHTSAGDRVLTWAARSRVGSTNLAEAQTGTTTVTLAANTWKIVDVARMTLPPVAMGTAGKVRIELTGVASMDLDEAWLFNLDDGNLTWVDCGTSAPSAGGSANRLFIDSPTPESPTYQYYIGTASDRSDQFYALTVKSEGHHELVPSSVNVFTVTPNSVASLLGFEYFRRAWTRIKKP